MALMKRRKRTGELVDHTLEQLFEDLEADKPEDHHRNHSASGELLCRYEELDSPSRVRMVAALIKLIERPTVLGEDDEGFAAFKDRDMKESVADSLGRCRHFGPEARVALPAMLAFLDQICGDRPNADADRSVSAGIGRMIRHDPELRAVLLDFLAKKAEGQEG